MLKTINVSEIIIPKEFERTIPRKDKLEKIYKYVKAFGNIDKPIVLKENNVLADNYARYIVAKELGMTDVPYITTQEYIEENPERTLRMTYVVGKFNGNAKEYTWKLNKELDINIGDKVLVKTKRYNGKGTTTEIVTVVNTFTSNNPSLLRHKSVIGKITDKESIDE